MIFLLCSGRRGGGGEDEKEEMFVIFIFYVWFFLTIYIICLWRGFGGSEWEGKRERERESWEWSGLFNNILSKIKLLLSTNR